MQIERALSSFWPLFLTVLTACASTPLELGPLPRESARALAHTPCSIPIPKPLPDSATAALDLFSDLLEAGCYPEAIALGRGIRQAYRQKTYSITSELVSVLVPEDSLSEYVLESYERAYLSFLLASAYRGLGQSDEARVEVRKSYTESLAELYNFGEDPVNVLLLAAFWDNAGREHGEPGLGRPFWFRLAGLLDEKSMTAKFAREQVERIDSGRAHDRAWRIVALGRLPKLDWSMSFGREQNSGYYAIRPLGAWPRDCRSATGTVLSTSSWVRKIRARYASSYHPLLQLKSWVRLPIGLAYGATMIAAGAGVALAGCGLTKGSADACEAAVRIGGAIAGESANVTSYALAPDLRHWSRVPAAVLVTTATTDEQDDCWATLPEPARLVAFPL